MNPSSSFWARLTAVLQKIWKIPFVREGIFATLVLCTAYGGGYYFGRHPNSLRELVGSKSLVIMTTQENLIPEELQAWIEDKWGHSMIVQVVGEDEIKKSATQADLVLLPKNIMDSLGSQIAAKPDEVDTSMILVDLLRKDSKAIPLLWSLDSQGDGFYRLHLMELGWANNNPKTIDLVTWLLSEDFQKQWSDEIEMNPVRVDLLRKKKDAQSLREIPLEKLRYD